MHELSVATALVAQAERAWLAAGSPEVVAVRLRLGALSGLVPDSLQFGFSIACEGTGLDGAGLDVERVPAAVRCAPCDRVVELVSTTSFRCPSCGTPSADVVAGRELELVSLEVRDGPDSPDSPEQLLAGDDARAGDRASDVALELA